MWWLCLALWGCTRQVPPASAGPVDLWVVGSSGAVAVRDGVVVGRSDRTPEPDGVRVLRGDRVTAGFVDAHAHPRGLAARRARLDLTGLDTYAATLDAVAAEPGAGWVIGSGWDHTDWTDPPAGGWPRARDLDAKVGERRVALYRIDGHASWVSSAVLREAGITRQTPDPAGGRILRDEAGEATGVLVDRAMDLVVTPDLPGGDPVAQMRDALEAVAATGLVGVHAMGVGDGPLAIHTELARSGELPVRIWAYLAADSRGAERLLAEGPWTIGRLEVVGIKAFADGALGSRGALLSEPYVDEPAHSGLAVTDEAALADLASRCLAARVQLAVHAIGDLAVHRTLNAFEAARRAHPEADDLPLRVEHAQVVRPDDRDRFGALNVIASMQPTHATSDMPWAEARLGPERVHWAYAWRSLRDAGAPIAFGSDFPVEAVDPGLGLWAATTRQSPSGNPAGGWMPAERLTMDEAIEAFTTGSARARGSSEGGRLDVGAPADLTVWSTEAGHWTAVATVVGGEVVWSLSPDAPDASPEAPPSPDR